MTAVIKSGLLIGLLCFPGRAFPWGREGPGLATLDLATGELTPVPLNCTFDINVAEWASDGRILRQAPHQGPHLAHPAHSLTKHSVGYTGNGMDESRLDWHRQ